MSVDIRIGDCRALLADIADRSVHCVVTSPPYFGLRDYGHDAQMGTEPTPQEFVSALTGVFREVWRVLRDDGTVWLNLGDSYAGTGKSGGGAQGKRWEKAGHDFTGPRGGKWCPAPEGLKQKDLIGIPWRVAFALQDDGWYLRQDIVWHKPNPMPESVRDRCTRAHEYLFMLTKSKRYYYDSEAVREPQAASTVARLAQNVSAQKGSDRQPGRNGRPMRAVGAQTDKQRGHGRRHAGFNERWDAMTKEEQQAKGRNRRSVWSVATRSYKGAHFATFPPALVEPCVLAGCPAGGMVLDPFAGSGTVGAVASSLGRRATLLELNPAYRPLIEERLEAAVPKNFDALIL